MSGVIGGSTEGWSLEGYGDIVEDVNSVYVKLGPQIVRPSPEVAMLAEQFREFREEMVELKSKVVTLERYAKTGRAVIYRCFLEKIGTLLWLRYGEGDSTELDNIASTAAKPDSARRWKSFYRELVSKRVLTKAAGEILGRSGLYDTLSRTEVHFSRTKEEYKDAIMEEAKAEDQTVLLDLVDSFM